jgi:YgiT-type zinc finger domain-containing protein
MVRGTVADHTSRKGYHLIFDAIPAWVCTQCGAYTVEGDTIEVTQAAIVKLDESAAQLAQLVAASSLLPAIESSQTSSS